MSQENSGRRLIRHGMVLFLLGLLTGILIPTLTSPRLALAAHMEGLLNGIFLIVVGGVLWKELRLSERAASASVWLLLIAAYASWGFCLLAAAFGASQTLADRGQGLHRGTVARAVGERGAGRGGRLHPGGHLPGALRTARDQRSAMSEPAQPGQEPPHACRVGQVRLAVNPDQVPLLESDLQ